MGTSAESTNKPIPEVNCRYGIRLLVSVEHHEYKREGAEHEQQELHGAQHSQLLEICLEIRLFRTLSRQLVRSPTEKQQSENDRKDQGNPRQFREDAGPRVQPVEVLRKESQIDAYEDSSKCYLLLAVIQSGIKCLHVFARSSASFAEGQKGQILHHCADNARAMSTARISVTPRSRAESAALRMRRRSPGRIIMRISPTCTTPADVVRSVHSRRRAVSDSIRSRWSTWTAASATGREAETHFLDQCIAGFPIESRGS